MYHVVGVFDFTNRHAVGQADGQEKAAQQRDDAAQQRRPQERMGLGIAEQAVVGKGHEEDDGQIQDGGDEGVAQGLFSSGDTSGIVRFSWAWAGSYTPMRGSTNFSVIKVVTAVR